MDDIIKPLFVHLQNLWGSLGILHESMRHDSSLVKGKTLQDLSLEVQTANKTLHQFVNAKYVEMSLLLPSPFPWVFAPFDELVEWKIIEPISQGKKPTDDITLAVNTAMKIQEELRRLVGFETSVKVESIYPFKKSYSQKKDTDKENVKLLYKRRKWLTKRAFLKCMVISLAIIVFAFILELARMVFSPDLSMIARAIFLLFIWGLLSGVIWFLGLTIPDLMEIVFDMLGFKEKEEKLKV